jgi:hypothetical protein
MQTQLVKIKDLKNNIGQIDGLPKNPRILKDDKFIKLKKSLEEDPEMLELREVIAYDNNGELIVICGNMRLKALKELGIKEVPTKILPAETNINKLKAYTIKDNVSFGDHDWEVLSNEWDSEQLEDWGLDMPITKDLNEQDLFDIEIPFYTPSLITPEINELANLDKTKNLIDKINSLEVDNELREVLKVRASFFTDFNFQKIADYYSSQDGKIQEVFKDLGLVILAPKEAIEKGFIELSESVFEL